MIYIFVPFFSVTDCDQNYMQMINLKKLPEYWPFQIIQNFRNSSRSCAIFIIYRAQSKCPLSVFECADPMRNIYIFTLWSFTFSGHLIWFSYNAKGFVRLLPIVV